MALPAVIDLTTLDGTLGYIHVGIAHQDYTGAAVDVIGDFNGDGLDDYVIGAYFADPAGGSNAGSAYVVFGSAGARPLSSSLSTLDGTDGFRIDGPNPDHRLGWSVSAAGDINGDGLADLVLSGQGDSSLPGFTYLIWGTGAAMPATLEANALGSRGVRFDGPPTSDAGYNVGPAGDFNGDGVDDFLIGAPASPGGAGFGAVYLIYGGRPLSGTVSLAALTPSQGFVLPGLAGNDFLGFWVNTAGDLNNDGLSDIVMGAMGADPLGRSRASEVYVVFGRETPFPAGFGLDDLDGTNGFLLQGAQANENAYRTLTIGDVNGDGVDDLAVAAESYDGFQDPDAGKVTVIYGRADGHYNAVYDLNAVVGQEMFRVVGSEPNQYFGDWIDAAGDVNGDGLDDFLVGAGGYDGGKGAVFLFYGREDARPTSSFLSSFGPTDGVRLTAGPNEVLFTAAGGDVNGDGLDDIVMGAEGISGQGPSAFSNGRVFVVYGQSSTAATTGADSWTGTAAADRWKALGGNDTLQGLAGNDRIDGGPGVDKSVYAGASGQYDFWEAPDGSWRVKDLRDTSPEGTDTLLSVESLQFSDRTVKILGLTTAEKLTDAYTNVLRNVASGSELTFLNNLIAAVNGSTKTLSAAIGEIVQKADGTTAVATLSYQFFAGFTPSKGGFDYLVSPQGPNPNNINSAYYQNFSFENRYINFAVNLGKLGEGAAGFQAEYGNKTLFEATKAAYMEIFGGTVGDGKIALILDSDVGNGLTRKDYFAVYGGDGLQGIGTKAAMVGWLLTEAAKADLGMYARSSNAFLADLADGAETRIDLIGAYGEPGYVFNG